MPPVLAVSLPIVSLPAISLPVVSLPAVYLPAVSLPAVSLPDHFLLYHVLLCHCLLCHCLLCHCLLCHCLLCHCLLCHSVALGITDWTLSTDPLRAMPETNLLQRGLMWNKTMIVILGTTKDTHFLVIYVKAINWTRSLLVSRGGVRGWGGMWTAVY